jgi:hypothetical protein
VFGQKKRLSENIETLDILVSTIPTIEESKLPEVERIVANQRPLTARMVEQLKRKGNHAVADSLKEASKLVDELLAERLR